MKIELNVKTDCTNTMSNHDVFYWTLRGLDGYEVEQNAADIYNVVLSKNYKHYSIKKVEFVAEDNTYVLKSVELEENTEFDKAYLEGELFEDTQYVIDENTVSIVTRSTCFCREGRQQNIDIKDLLDNLKTLNKLCKDNKIKLSGLSKVRKEIKENEDIYEIKKEKSDILFDKLIEVAEEVKTRGIHYKCIDDIVLKKLADVKSKYQSMYYRSTLLSKYNALNYKVSNYIDEISSGTGYIKICL